ncbi:MerR family transcriptional regulator, partial [Candidatus Dojkabacteria bacterium]|nr:MerR family transcriptional regulator [Candidatus Dojkabacteria bacterium]
MNLHPVYTISELAELAGISVRTLRHYDIIGILEPCGRNESGHRIYNQENLIRLQHILFYKEIDLSLKAIKKILATKDSTTKFILEEQKELLKKKKDQYELLIQTIENTILHFNKLEMVKDEDLYEGLSTKEISAMKAEVKTIYNSKIIAESNRNIRKLSKQQFTELKEEGKTIAKTIA